MRNLFKIHTSLFLIMILASTIIAQDRPGRIYGKVTTANGDEYEGRIIWGAGENEHETIWNHTFDATYNFYDHNRDVLNRQRERQSRRLGDLPAEFYVMFGHIAEIERSRAGSNVLLKDGREFEVSTDDSRESVTILDAELGKVVISRRDFEKIEFMDEPDEYTRTADENGYPIFGTITTSSGMTFTGFILWDNDESLSTHIINGNEGRNAREIPFSKIQSIIPVNRRSSEINLWTGRKLILSGTNDVASDNRGLIITDQSYGIVDVEWRYVDKIDFERDISGMRYSDFKAGTSLFGTLVDDSGDEYEGFIRWDDDEHFSTDLLNGEFENIAFKLEFSNILEIRRRSRTSATVVLRNGKELLLRNSNDVNYENKGIVVLERADDALKSEEEGRMLRPQK